MISSQYTGMPLQPLAPLPPVIGPSQTFTSGGGGSIPQAPRNPPRSSPVMVPTTVSSTKKGSPYPVITQNPWSQNAIGSATAAGQRASGESSANIGSAGQLRDYSGQMLGTAFDPQQALYNRTLQRLQDQQRVGQSARGITSSPYGAGLENQALSDFNIDWENNQLQRQLAGLGGAREGYSTAGNIGQMGVGQLAQSGKLPFDIWRENQANDMQMWLAYQNMLNAQVGSEQANYPNLLAQQSMQNYGGVPYIPQNTGFIPRGY